MICCCPSTPCLFDIVLGSASPKTHLFCAVSIDLALFYSASWWVDLTMVCWVFRLMSPVCIGVADAGNKKTHPELDWNILRSWTDKHLFLLFWMFSTWFVALFQLVVSKKNTLCSWVSDRRQSVKSKSVFFPCHTLRYMDNQWDIQVCCLTLTFVYFSGMRDVYCVMTCESLPKKLVFVHTTLYRQSTSWSWHI